LFIPLWFIVVLSSIIRENKYIKISNVNMVRNIYYHQPRSQKSKVNFSIIEALVQT